MKVLTEAEVRTAYFVRKQREFAVSPDTLVSSEAKAFIEKFGLSLTRSANAVAPEKKSVERRIQVKPEHMTHLRKGELISKNDDRIRFRGLLDSSEAQLLKSAAVAERNGCSELAGALLEALSLLRRAMAADVKNEPLGDWSFIGLSPDELREHSQHPEKYFGIGHQLPSIDQGFAALELNLLRAKLRELEAGFARAYVKGETVQKGDILLLLNRLSSGMYLLYLKEVKKNCGKSCAASRDMSVLAEASARHVHLSKKDAQALFGHPLTKKRELSQKGQFVCEERLTLRGEKGVLERVAVLGPERERTQVEISLTDARLLGVDAPLRLSGDLRGAADIELISESASIKAKGCVIAAKNHVHLSPAEASELGLSNGQLVDFELCTERPLLFKDVVIRVSESGAKAFHVDFDEANAAMLKGGEHGNIVIK